MAKPKFSIGDRVVCRDEELTIMGVMVRKGTSSDGNRYCTVPAEFFDDMDTGKTVEVWNEGRGRWEAEADLVKPGEGE